MIKNDQILKSPNKQAIFEKIEPQFGSSIIYKRFHEFQENVKPTWHFHPEIEIAYIKEGSGKRYVGNHMSAFSDGNLMLLGPNIPHYGFKLGISREPFEVVVQFKEAFLGADFFSNIEFSKINQLIERSKSGLSFYGETKRFVGERLENMHPKDPLERLISLIRILEVLASSEEVEILNIDGYHLAIKKQDNNRIDAVYDYVRSNYDTHIGLDEIAELTMMTIPAFCRFFKKTTQKTFIQFVNEFRIVHACKLLAETEQTITEISFDCGFNNFSHFNKQFNKITGKSPSGYRKELKYLVS